MARYDHQFWDSCSSDTEARASIDDLIRPSLLQAFPLPADDHGQDHRFRLLLDALAQRRGGSCQVAQHGMVEGR
jgi:hypothetical protein